MSRNGLGAKWIRRLNRLTELDIAHASADAYNVQFTTTDHRHGWFDMKVWKYSGENPMWGLYDEGHCPHFVSCRLLFTDVESQETP